MTARRLLAALAVPLCLLLMGADGGCENSGSTNRPDNVKKCPQLKTTADPPKKGQVAQRAEIPRKGCKTRWIIRVKRKGKDPAIIEVDEATYRNCRPGSYFNRVERPKCQ